MSKKILLTLALIFIGLTCFTEVFPSFAWSLTIPWEWNLTGPSITVPVSSGNGITILQWLGYKILGIAKMFISWIALISLVMIGVMLIVHSDTEDKIKSQKKQLIYALTGFLFLNIPGALYSVFLPAEKWWNVLPDNTPWSQTSGSFNFWDSYGFDGIFGGIIAFFRVFIFAVAVLMFTWGLFRMIVSSGDEEIRKQWKNRILYGTFGLVFVGFMEWWSRLIADGDFQNYVPYIGNRIVGIAIFFAAPIAIFFLIWWAYHYITSGWDEERMKKWKSIVINTCIAGLILIATLSFLTDIIKFTL